LVAIAHEVEKIRSSIVIEDPRTVILVSLGILVEVTWPAIQYNIWVLYITVFITVVYLTVYVLAEAHVLDNANYSDHCDL